MINNIITAMEEMEVGEEDMTEGDDLTEDKKSEEEGGGLGGPLSALEPTELLNQDMEPGGTNFVDDHNSFNKLIRLEMIWTACHRWPAGARSTFNCYRHWA